jgi:hydroxyethylthiazole kinase-like uncharacterized protein yjeF
MGARIASAGETVACESAVIESGTPAWDLMTRAGERAASLIVERFADVASDGVVVFAGTGNNGGDGWVVAGCLARNGYACRVDSRGSPKSEEAIRARAQAISTGVSESARVGSHERLLVDAVLGTGATGKPRDAAAEAIRTIGERQIGGAAVVSLDLPSGLDSTTGKYYDAVRADMTVAFGMLKRGHLLAREICGDVSVVDIGLDCESADCLPLLIDEAWVRARVPSIPWTAHKGTRKRLSVVGGGRGMAGAAILAGEGALRSGAGLLRLIVAPGNEVAVFAAIPAAIAGEWPETVNDLEQIVATADAIAVGPGLGKTPHARDLVERVLLAWNGPVVLDADALNVFEGDTLSLSQLLKGRPAVITPHPAEFGRLMGIPTEEVLGSRFDIGIDLAAQLGAAVLLKGTPTIVFSPSGERFVSATGTAALATGGSGDVLTGIIGTLAAQMCGGTAPSHSAAEAAACGAFVHGRAAELCVDVRGTTLADILDAMPRAWNLETRPLSEHVLATVRAVS